MENLLEAVIVSLRQIGHGRECDSFPTFGRSRGNTAMKMLSYQEQERFVKLWADAYPAVENYVHVLDPIGDLVHIRNEVAFEFVLWSMALMAFVSCATTHAAAGSKPVFVGPAVCAECHRLTRQGELAGKTNLDSQMPPGGPKLVEAWSKSAHAATLINTRSSPEKVVAQFAANSPLQLSQIAYAIGVGRGEQRYCDASFTMLPHRWDVPGKKWTGESVVDARGQCFGCHVTGYDVDTKRWHSPGVTCEACHGPGSLHAQDGGKTKMLNLRSLPFERQAMICGQCHSDGSDPAKKHPFPVGFRPGDKLNQSFVQAAQPRPGPKYSELLHSKHAQMNVICTDCHDPHGPVPGTTHQLLKPVNELCTECHVEETMAKHAPNIHDGATCATCHMPGGSHAFNKPVGK